MSKQMSNRTFVWTLIVLFCLSVSLIVWQRVNAPRTVEARIDPLPKRFSVQTPSEHQLFQRDENDLADIPVHLTVYGGMRGQIIASWNGGESQVLAEDFSGTEFRGVLKGQPVGQGTLKITLGSKTREIERVSVGDLYVVAGQSNAMGGSFPKYEIAQDLDPQPSTFDGRAWREIGSEPVNIYHLFANKPVGGTLWPRLAELLTKKYEVPVAIIDVSMGGSGLVSPGLFNTDWKEGHGLYGNLVRVVRDATDGSNNFAALLFFQGETDAIFGISGPEYAKGLRHLKGILVRDLGRDFPFVVGKIAYFNFSCIKISKVSPEEGFKRIDEIRDAQQQVSKEKGFVLGPDGAEVELGPDGIHFSSAEALEKLANKWVEAIDPLIQKSGKGIEVASSS